MNLRVRTTFALALLLLASHAQAEEREVAIDVHSFQVVKQDSGPVDYYRVVEDPDGAYIHSAYEPPMETMTKGWAVPDALRHAFHHLRWRWRAVTLPRGGNECAPNLGDSAAVLYVTWRRTFRWYAVKYVWSPVAPKGSICNHKSNPFRVQDTVVLETGGPLGVWRTEEIDLDAEYRQHFEGGNPTAEVPDFMGIAVMSDGDQTHSSSSADFGGFELLER